MPIHAHWTDETRTVIYTRFQGSWTLTEFAQVLLDIKDMTRDVAHPVYAIAVGEDTRMPRTGNLLPHLRRLFMLPLTHIYTVPGTPIATAVLSVLAQLTPDWQERITFVGTVVEAQAQVAARLARDAGDAGDAVPSAQD